MWYFILAIVSIVTIVGLFYYRGKKHDLTGKHILVTGGSKGIGRSLAAQAIECGANVTILARDAEALEETKMELLKKCPVAGKQKVLVQSVDVSGDYMDVEKAVTEAEDISGPVDMLVCCAGTSVSHRFEETSITAFHRMMDVNYFGTVNTIKAVLPSMKTSGSGNIIVVSSVAGLFGLYGYSAYSASKFAVVGLAQALAMELKPFNIKVTVSFPPDTDTPGFKQEQLSKPLETKLISESGGLYSADVVAKKILKDAMEGNFTSTVGFESWMVKTVCSGMMPFNSFMEVILQVLTMGLFRIFATVFLQKCDKTVSSCASERQLNKKSD